MPNIELARALERELKAKKNPQVAMSPRSFDVFLSLGIGLPACLVSS